MSPSPRPNGESGNNTTMSGVRTRLSVDKPQFQTGISYLISSQNCYFSYIYVRIGEHQDRLVNRHSRSGRTRIDAIEGVEPIREFLKESDAPKVKQGELENILEDLADN